MAAPANCFKICLADLNKKCTIEKRSVQGAQIGEVNATESFSIVYTGWFNIKTGVTASRGTSRFSGVNINKEATHMFTTRYRNSISRLDGEGEHFLRYSNVFYRVLDITNLNEDNEWLMFQCTERGTDTKKAAHA